MFTPKTDFFTKILGLKGRGSLMSPNLGNAALVLSSKIGKNIQDGACRRKINPKSLWLSAALQE